MRVCDIFSGNPTLLVDPHPAAEMLVDAMGRAVWPARGADDMQRLSTLANHFSLELNAITGTVGRTEACDEIVLGLGEEVRDLCELYAHLTRRRAKVIESPVTAGQLSPLPEVVLGLAERFTPDLLDMLYSRSESLAPGIVFGTSLESLRTSVLLRAAAAEFVISGDGAVTELLPTVDCAEVRSIIPPHARILGRQATSDQIRRALDDHPSVLTICAHSDGVDASLGPLVLCSIRNAMAVAERPPIPTCVERRRCHRLKMPLEAALKTSHLLDPEELTAAFAILDVCWGFLSHPSTVHPEWGWRARLR